MKGRVCVVLPDCAKCIGIPKADIVSMAKRLEAYPSIDSVKIANSPCLGESRAEIRNLSADGCDRAVICLWCSPEHLGSSLALPRGMNRHLIEFLDLSFLVSKDAKATGQEPRIERAIRACAARLSLSEPLRERKLNFASRAVAVIGSSDRAIEVARRLARHGIEIKVIVTQPSSAKTDDRMELVDDALPESLSGVPGDFVITVRRRGETKSIRAAALLLVSERSISEVKVPNGSGTSFVPLEQFSSYSARGSKVRGIAFLDDLSSLASSSGDVVPAWHDLLESAKTAAYTGLADQVNVLARDVKAIGLHELAWREAAEAGVKFIRFDDTTRPRFDPKSSTISVKDLVLGESLELPADVIVAPTITRPWELLFIEGLFVPSDWDFRVRARGPQRGPGQSTCDGIFLLGYADFNQITDAMDPEADSVIAQIVSYMRLGHHVVRGTVAEIDEEKCSACYTCVRTCPYRAVTMNESWKADIIADKCAGCGNCIAVCPSRAIDLKNCTRPQIEAQVKTSLEVVL